MAPGRRNRVIPRSVWYLIAAAAAKWYIVLAAARGRRAAIIILPHYNNIIAHFSLLVKPFAHFLADVEEWVDRPFCVVNRLNNLNMLSSPSINQWKRFHNFVQKQQDPSLTLTQISHEPRQSFHRLLGANFYRASIMWALGHCWARSLRPIYFISRHL